MMEKKMDDRELRTMGALAYRLVRMGWMNAAKLEQQLAAFQIEVAFQPFIKQPESAPVKKGRGRPKKPKDMYARTAGIPDRLINAACKLPGVQRAQTVFLSDIAKFRVVDLMRQKNCGMKSIRQAQAILVRHGYSFPDADKIK